MVLYEGVPYDPLGCWYDEWLSYDFPENAGTPYSWLGAEYCWPEEYCWPDEYCWCSGPLDSMCAPKNVDGRKGAFEADDDEWYDGWVETAIGLLICGTEIDWEWPPVEPDE